MGWKPYNIHANPKQFRETTFFSFFLTFSFSTICFSTSAAYEKGKMAKDDLK